MVGILLLYFLMINPLNSSDSSDSSESSEPVPDDGALTPAGNELPSVGAGVADGIINIGNNTLNQVFGLNRTYTV